ncbi:MAG TPA: undecaprenyl-diphosphate phosphatase [Bacteroidales bacterium]|nr:undecaprenyl-diphosphate phosphatase [Bacteroidales bacterium]HPS46752.1 undecaprenyl-diphosphate phosphatase [Bacteroidales bacterium]
MTYLEAIIIAIVEGITEFLPISSTGHMIITQAVLGIPYTDFVKAFTVNIQFGAILSVIILYWKHFFQSVHFYYKLFVAFIPAAIIGFLLGDYIDAMLENVVVVAVSLVIGGIILLFVDNWFKNADDTQKEVSYKQALKIGFFQCIAMIPGVSRSAATIIGGLSQKLNRKYAAEFSFFLAVPTMFAASAYKLLKTYEVIDATNIKILIVGNITAFVVALIAIRTFITYLQKHGFKLFGYYRIILGLVILLLLLFGIPLNLGL